MKKVLTLLCLLVITTGVANAHPFVHQNYQKSLPAPHKVALPPKPMPVAYQYPVQIPAYQNYGYSSPSVTFSVGNVDVTLGL